MWPRIPGRCRGRGWRLRSSGAGPSQRGQEARTPGIVSRSRSPSPGRKFCRVLSAGASLAILLNRKQGSAGAGRWRREHRTTSPPRAYQDKWRRGQRADTEVLGGLGGGADLGWGGGLQVAGSSPGSTKHPSRTAQEPELSGLGRSAARDGSCPLSGGGGRRTAARRPGTGEAQVQAPCADSGVGAAVTLVCLPSRGRRAPPGEGSVLSLQGPSPLPRSLSSSLPPGSGKETRTGSPPHPASDPALRGASLQREPRSKFFQAWPSSVQKGPGEDEDGTGAAVPAIRVVQNANSLARTGDAPARRQAGSSSPEASRPRDAEPLGSLSQAWGWGAAGA